MKHPHLIQALGLVLLLQCSFALGDDHFRDILDEYHHQLAENNGEFVGRQFFASNISLVITYVTIVVAALMLAGFLWMAFAFSGNNNNNSYHGRRRKREGYSDDQDAAEKMHWINESFKKYQIADEGCKMYVACEAGKSKGQADDSLLAELTTYLHKLIAPIQLQDVDSLGEELGKIFLAYQEGSMLDMTCSDLYSAICSNIV